jgi:hypothetical protein
MNLSAKMVQDNVLKVESDMFSRLFQIIDDDDDEDDSHKDAIITKHDNLTAFRALFLQIDSKQDNAVERLCFFELDEETILEKAVRCRCKRIIELLVDSHCYPEDLSYECVKSLFINF